MQVVPALAFEDVHVIVFHPSTGQEALTATKILSAGTNLFHSLLMRHYIGNGQSC